MDSILEHIILAQVSNQLDSQDEFDEDNKISLWVVDKDMIVPSTNISLKAALEPGMYEVEFSKNQGFYCKKFEPITDELFTFSNSLTLNVLKEINLFWEKKDLYADKNYLHKRGIFLEGYPGTGKTSLITQICNEVIKNGGVVFRVQDFKNLSDYVEFMIGAFRKIQPDTPVITIIEDIDKYVEVETELLDFLDGKTNINHHVVIATSNNTEDIPDTLLRASRFDIRIELPSPDETTRREYFTFKGVKEEIIKALIKPTEGCSLADLKEIYICIHFLDYSVEEALLKVKNPKDRKNYLFKSTKSSKIGL